MRIKHLALACLLLALTGTAFAVDGRKQVGSDGIHYCYAPLSGGGHESFKCSWSYVDCSSYGPKCTVDLPNGKTLEGEVRAKSSLRQEEILSKTEADKILDSSLHDQKKQKLKSQRP